MSPLSPTIAINAPHLPVLSTVLKCNLVVVVPEALLLEVGAASQPAAGAQSRQREQSRQHVVPCPGAQRAEVYSPEATTDVRGLHDLLDGAARQQTDRISRGSACAGKRIRDAG